MDLAYQAPRSRLRTLLVLGRTSNLPTVWTNCLAGWLIGGGGYSSALLLLCLAATALYVGGMYLNDAFDESFDRQHRPERPIPSGAISATTVWVYGFAWLILGVLLFCMFGGVTTMLAVLLVLSILLYDLVHKMVVFSPVLMALCRFFLFLTAVSAGAGGDAGLGTWAALALACYIVGLSYVARTESVRGPLRYWPCLLLLAPIVFAWLSNAGPFKTPAMIISIALLFWIVRCLWFTFVETEKNVGRTVSGLLAGICIVDLLAVGGGSLPLTFVFLGLFVAALFFQRFIPAT